MAIFPENVSRETLEKLEIYAELLRKWNPRINLVSRGTIDDLYDRHIWDSAQIANYQNLDVDHWVDLGSGAGFPGVVIAIIAAETAPSTKFTLIESDLRKSAFLKTVLRDTNTDVTVISERIEKVEGQKADVISARALADLSDLLGFCRIHMSETGQAVFLKGKSWQSEIKNAQNQWNFKYQAAKSITNEDAAVLLISEVYPRERSNPT